MHEYTPHILVSCGSSVGDNLNIALRDADGDLITKWYAVPQDAGDTIATVFNTEMPETNDNELARNRFRKLIKTHA
jgi:hypothetical protein